jgi:ribulose 1,5-bisphosphate carboxylase large subunit-like protein
VLADVADDVPDQAPPVSAQDDDVVDVLVPLQGRPPAAAWPAPGGGITLDRVDDVLATYGHDVMLLVGGAVHRGDVAANSRRLRAAVERAAPQQHY